MRNFCLSLFLLVCLAPFMHGQLYYNDADICDPSTGGQGNLWLNGTDKFEKYCDWNAVPQQIVNLGQLAALNFAQRATCVLASDYTNTSTTFSNVCSFPILSGSKYALTCNQVYNASALTSGPKYRINSTNSPTTVRLMTPTGGPVSGLLTSLGISGISLGTDTVVQLGAGVVNSASDATLTLQAAAQGLGTVTIRSGSVCTLEQQ